MLEGKVPRGRICRTTSPRWTLQLGLQLTIHLPGELPTPRLLGSNQEQIGTGVIVPRDGPRLLP